MSSTFKHRASMLALATLIAPSIALAQFTVVGQTGTARSYDTIESFAPGQLTSAKASALTVQMAKVNFRVEEHVSALAESTIAPDALTIVSDAFVSYTAKSGLTGPQSTRDPFATASIQLDFDLATATDVRLFLDNTPTYFGGTGPSSSTSLLHWLDNGQKESIALPTTQLTGPNSLRYSGEAFVTLAAGHYSMLSQVSPAANYDGGQMGATNRFSVTAVPEASTFAMMALGLGALLVARRRQS